MSSAQQWVDVEFESLRLGDKRLERRFRSVLTDLARHCGKTLGSSFDSLAKLKGGYRFFANARVSLRAMLAPHVSHTVERARAHKTVLALQDTTFFDYAHRPKTDGLDIVNRSRTNDPIEGLMLHNTLAITTTGLPLGLLDQRFISRKKLHQSHKEQGKTDRSRASKSIKNKESQRWVDVLRQCHALDLGSTQLVHVCDREADIYELFRDASLLEEKVLVRASHNRAINKSFQHEEATAWLFDKLSERRAQGRTRVTLQVNGKKKHREATLSIVYMSVSLPAPTNRTVAKDGDSLPMVSLTAIMAVEKQGSVPLKDRACWTLLTNLPVADVNSAIEKVHWYAQRWNIEVFHKVLKSGCGVEKAQLASAERLKRYITVKSIIAWRLFWLSRVQESDPDGACDQILDTMEWQLLHRKINKTRSVPEKIPTIREVFIWIAKLGGYLNRKSDPDPGIISLWRGWERLSDIVDDHRDICG